MFDEFRSNLMLLLHCKHPDGMMLDRLESEYLKYFCQTVRPYMFYIEATDWLKVMTETPLRNDTKIWENNKSEMYVKCVVSRSESEMKLIAKLAKHSHFQFAQNSHFHLESCNCCSLPLSISTKPYGDGEVFEPTGDDTASCHTKDVDLEEEHLDRGCFMGVIATNDDDLITSEFLVSKYINSCDSFSIATKDNNILNEVKREVSSPTNIDNNNYTHEYLMNSQDLELQNHFGDVDMSNVKLENDIFTPLADEMKTYSFSESTLNENVQVKAEPSESDVTEIYNKKAVSESQTIGDNNYEPNSTEEIVGIKYEPNISSEQTPSSPLPLNQVKSVTVMYIADKPGEHVCQWKDCKEVFVSQQELLKHIPSHTIAMQVEKPVNSQNVLSAALCHSSAVKASAKEDKSKPPTRKRVVSEVITPNTPDSKSKRRNTRPSTSHDEAVLHCTTLGCNRSFATKCKLTSHQRRCCAINDFSCRWPGCTMVFQSSLDLHNHVKIEHRKCTDNINVPPGPGQVEKNIVLNCSVASCAYAFTCPTRLAAHQKSCTLKQSRNQRNGIFNSNPNFTRPTLTASAQGQSPSTPNPITPTPTINDPKNKETRPKGFARVSRYSN